MGQVPAGNTAMSDIVRVLFNFIRVVNLGHVIAAGGLMPDQDGQIKRVEPLT